MFSRFCAPLLTILVMTAPIAAHAQGEPSELIDSVIIGALAHEVVHDEEGGLDANLEVRLRPVLRHGWRAKVMPTIGGTVNYSGGTNTLYAGVTARYALTESVFIEGFFGMTVHDADTPNDDTALDLGCTLLFREGAGIGYQHEQHALSLYISHASHGDMLCDATENDGITSVGLRYGMDF